MASASLPQTNNGDLSANEDEYSKDSSNEKVSTIFENGRNETDKDLNVSQKQENEGLNEQTLPSPPTSQNTSNDKKSMQNSDDEDIITQRLAFLSLPDVPQGLPVEQSAEKGKNKVEDLSKNERMQLARWLDEQCGNFPNWYLLGREMFKDNSRERESLEDLKACYCGGGNQGLTFLDILLSGFESLTSKEFADAAKSLKRMDIYGLLKGKTCQLKDIEDSERTKLATLLCKRIVKNWEDFAEYYNMSKEEIEQIRNSIKKDSEYSPTNRLLKKFSAQGFILREVEKACIDLEMIAVADVIREIRK